MGEYLSSFFVKNKATRKISSIISKNSLDIAPFTTKISSAKVRCFSRQNKRNSAPMLKWDKSFKIEKTAISRY